MKRALHPCGKEIVFNPAWHTYTMSGVGKLKSVSKVLDAFFPFDSQRVSSLVAKKTGQTQKDVLKEWSTQALLGKNVHAHIEAILGKQPAPTFTEKHGNEAAYIGVAEPAVAKVLTFYDVVGIETIVASPELGIAGTIDFLGRNKKTGAYFVGDWKTSGSVHSNFRFGSFETPCPAPLSHLPNVKMSRYGLQVLIYGHILCREGYQSIYPGITDLPLEYGIIQFAKREGGGVGVQFKRITPDLLVPPCCINEEDGASIIRKVVTQ